MKYIAGSAPDGKRIRESTGTTSWEKARKILARKLAENDPVNKPLFGAVSPGKKKAPTTKTIAEAIEQFLETKRGESIVDMAHYEGLFSREFLPWCKEQGLFDMDELGLEQVTKFRNQLSNKGSVKNIKLSRLRSFFAFCMDRGDAEAARRLPDLAQVPAASATCRLFAWLVGGTVHLSPWLVVLSSSGLNHYGAAFLLG